MRATLTLTLLLGLAAPLAAQTTAPPVLTEAERLALEREVARGVGLVAEGPRGPREASPPCQADRSHCTVIHQQHSQAQNQRSAARLEEMHRQAVARCGGALPERPSLGMSVQRYFECTLAGPFSAVEQVVDLQLNGRALKLLVLGRSDLTRLYFVNDQLARIEP